MDAYNLNNFNRRQLGGVLSPILSPILPTAGPSSSSTIESSSSSVALSSPSASVSPTTSALPSSISPKPATVLTTDPPIVFSQTTIPGPTHFVTVDGSSSSNSSISSSVPSATAAAQHTPFLQNKVLSGIVFTFVGIVGLILIILAATFAIRRRRNKKLIEDAVAFAPVKIDADIESAQSHGEKSRASSIGQVSSNHEIRQAPSFVNYAPPVPRMYVPPQGMDRTSYINAQSPPPASYSIPGQPSQPAAPWSQRFSEANLIYSTPTSPAPPAIEIQHVPHSRPTSTEIQFAPVSGQTPVNILSYYEPTKRTSQGPV